MKTIVVIPTYDERDNVKKMADAVLQRQTSNPETQTLELLFVDDNSPDGTGDVIEEIMKTEPRIHCLHREK
jgi:dolichol-phosphate mannosyltransferase